jgi:hypothetical protein
MSILWLEAVYMFLFLIPASTCSIYSYGDHGSELINVTYTGDTLTATKATGDINVPRGQVSFSADLSPRDASTALEPLKLSFDPNSKVTKLPRFAGKGQIAKPGFVDHKYVQGQLVLFARHFSFVWLPTKHHVLFRRPTPDQTIEMLRNIISKEDELENMRDHVSRCFGTDLTESLGRQDVAQGLEPFRRISLQEDLMNLGTVEPKDDASSRFNFWQLHTWRQHIDDVLRDDNNLPEEDQS